MDASTGSCALVEGLRLGQAVNLLLAPAAPSLGREALAAPPRVPLREFPAALEPAANGGWQPLAVTLHRGATSIIERLWGCDVAPHRFDGPEFCIRTARLLDADGRAARAQRLREVLGIEVVDGRSYLLFELRRNAGRADHEVTAKPTRCFFDRERHLAPEWRLAASRLRPGERIHDGFEHDAQVGADVARKYVDAFYQYGTHFVSAVDAGDVLVQLVALRPDGAGEAATCCARFGDGHVVSGVAALNLGRFLRPVYAAEVGPIASLAGDPALAGSLAQGAWGTTPSLMAALQSGPAWAREVLSNFSAVAALRVELTSLARFMEYYRAINFERVLRGALLQRWGDRVRLPFRRMPEVERCIAASEPASLSAGCHRVVSLRERRMHLAGPPVLAHYLDAAADSHAAAILTVPANGFEHGGIACQKMVGALVLEDGEGRRDTVVDGLRFCDAEPVRVRGDLHGLAPAFLPGLLPAIGVALADAWVMLSCADGEGATRGDAAGFAEWLAGLLPAGSGNPKVQRLRVFALYLARVEAAVPVATTGRDSAIVERHLEAIAALAIDADACVREPAKLQALRRALSARYLALLRELARPVVAVVEAPRLDAIEAVCAASTLGDVEQALVSLGGPDRSRHRPEPPPMAPARAAQCRVRIETWYHAVLDGALFDGFQFERQRLLATLGQALRRQGVPGPAAMHLGAMAHLLALRLPQAEECGA